MRRVLSVDRLERYRTTGDDDLSMVVTYLWNVELCESLYHILGALEVVMRNSIHGVLTTHYGQPDWYDIPGVLKWRQPGKVSKVKRDIRDGGKLVVPGRVVSGLDFGFWTTLMSSGYGSFWSQHNRALIKQAFPLAPIGMQYRGRVFDRFNSARLLRNRVFHYEAIGDDPDLVQKQMAIIDAIGWVSKALQSSVVAFDRFPAVHQHGWSPIDAKIKAHFAASEP